MTITHQMKMFKILVCGGRDYNDRYRLHEILSEYLNTPDLTIISGMAQGADMLAYKWAIANHIPVIEMPANWKKHGKAAGPIRNQEMLDLDPDLVIAFPGGTGTAHMCRITTQKGTPLRKIDWS